MRRASRWTPAASLARAARSNRSSSSVVGHTSPSPCPAARAAFRPSLSRFRVPKSIDIFEEDIERLPGRDAGLEDAPKGIDTNEKISMDRVEVSKGRGSHGLDESDVACMEQARQLAPRASPRNARVRTPATFCSREKGPGIMQARARAPGRGVRCAKGRAGTWHGSSARAKQALACRSTASTPPPPLLDPAEAKPSERMRRLESLIALKQLYRDSLRAYVILQEEMVRHVRLSGRTVAHERSEWRVRGRRWTLFGKGALVGEGITRPFHRVERGVARRTRG